MEYKVRKESQTLVEKLFMNSERRGLVRSYQMPSLLRSLNPEIVYDDEELKRVIAENDPEGRLGLDYDAFTRVIMHFLVRHVRRESDDFSHKRLVGLADFIDP